MPTPNRDQEHLAKLQSHYAETRRIPPQRRIADLIGFSKSAARKLLERLGAEGFVERTPDGDSWVPAKRFFERPLAGTVVRAGAPDLIQGDVGEPFLVDQYLVRDPSRTVMVQIKGDSMIDAGIHEGDIAVIERERAAVRGNFVIAIVDNEFTLKELDTERGRFVLKPRNPAYPVIRPKGELEIFGVLVGLIRRYSP